MILTVLNPDHIPYVIWDHQNLAIGRIVRYCTETQDAWVAEPHEGPMQYEGVELSAEEVENEFPGYFKGLGRYPVVKRVKLVGSYATDQRGNRI